MEYLTTSSMLNLPPEFLQQISIFCSALRKRTWPKVLLLLMGAILCPGSRTVCNVLRVLGLSEEKAFHKYHRVLSKARWRARQLARPLLDALVKALLPGEQALLFGIDETIERRWGRRIKKRGIYRDPVRSSKSHFVKCSGLRWMCLMLLSPLPWTGRRRWALPMLTALCPSERYYQQRRPKKLTDWARPADRQSWESVC